MKIPPLLPVMIATAFAVAGCKPAAQPNDPVATAKYLERIDAAEKMDRKAAVAASRKREKLTAQAAARRIARLGP